MILYLLTYLYVISLFIVVSLGLKMYFKNKFSKNALYVFEVCLEMHFQNLKILLYY